MARRNNAAWSTTTRKAGRSTMRNRSVWLDGFVVLVSFVLLAVWIYALEVKQ